MRFGFRRWQKNVKDGDAKPKDFTKEQIALKHLGNKSLVFIGLMGAGKSAIGRRVAARLGLSFLDADTEIEHAAGQKIADIFEDHGEGYFRDREEKIIDRLLQNGPVVLATGGGAFMSEVTQANIAKSAVSIWLKADLDVLMERVSRRDHRPLLRTENPRDVMKNLMDERYPIYGLADITIKSRDVSHETIVQEIIEALVANA